MKPKINNIAGPQIRSRTRPGFLLPALGITSIIAGLQAATQCFAYLFSYQPGLGRHIGYVYPPWDIIKWAAGSYDRYPNDFIRAGSMGAFCTTIGFLIIALVKVMTANTSKVNKYLHGSARWASFKEIKAAGLLAGGVYVGGWMDKRGKFFYLRHDGPEHVLTYAPTRSGKGVGLVIPTLLSWPSSCVVTDLKGELWALTSGWRKQHANNKVLLFEPAASDRGLCWNPLDEIRLNTDHEVGDVQNLANLIVDPDGRGLESHWQKTAFALLVGLILHVLYKAENSGSVATLSSIDAMIADPTRDVGDLWAEMITCQHKGGLNHPAVGSAARDMLDRPEEEAGSVLSTAKSYLVLYRDPIVAANTSKSEFRIRDLMHHDDPVSLYIVTQPNDKARLRPLVRILVNMIVRLSADKMEFKDGLPVARYRHRLLVMLDEFPSLGRLEILQESLAFVAGYGIKCYLICQDINQLKSRETGYGHDETITSNCHIQNAFPPNRIETAEHLSRLTGQTTVIKEQITTSGRRTAAIMGHVSRTMQEVQRALLTPDECLRMPGPRKNSHGEIEEAGDMVISVAGFPAIYGRQSLYFKDPVFKARAAIPAPVVSDKTVDRSQIRVIKL
jgi:type IV secretion system protein VirD4